MKKAIFLGASNTYGVGLHWFRDIYNTEETINFSFPFNPTGVDKTYI